MKTNRLALLGTVVLLFAISSCKRNLQDDLPPSYNTGNQQSSQQYFDQAVSNPNAYSITFIGPTQAGENWDWVWAIKNNNPGNGNNGTTQDLSHWGMSFGPCLDWTSVVGAAHSDDGIHWTSFTPSLEVDPASCVTTPVIKFDFGTNGSKTSYFRLTLNRSYQPGLATGYYKSGRKTGCIPFYFTGLSCFGS